MDRSYAVPARCRTLVIAIWLALATASSALAQTTAFTYQGRLTDTGNPATGTYDMQFKLFDTPAVGTGTQQGGTVSTPAVAVSAGLFTVTLDFGANVFSGPPRHLEIGVRTAGSPNPHAILSPRQPVTSSPYAVQTLNAQQLGGIPASRYISADANGNVGIGTSVPTAKLDVLTGSESYGIVHSTPSLPGLPIGIKLGTFIGTRAGATGGWFGTLTADPLHFFTTDSMASMTIDTNGNVGIGTSTPASRLHSLSNSGVGVRGETAAFNTFTNAGVVGRSTGFGGIGIIGEAHQDNSWGIYGVSQSPTGVGVYGQSAGFALYANGHTGQARDKGGWAKALVALNPDGTISRCYNGVTRTTSGTCGFVSGRAGAAGQYFVDFGFNVTDRFIAVTAISTPSVPSAKALLNEPIGNRANVTYLDPGEFFRDGPMMVMVF